MSENTDLSEFSSIHSYKKYHIRELTELEKCTRNSDTHETKVGKHSNEFRDRMVNAGVTGADQMKVETAKDLLPAGCGILMLYHGKR